MISEQFAILAFFLIMIGDSTYIIDTIKGKTQPNRVTWALWAVFAGLGLLGQLGEGVGMQTLLTGAVTLGPLLILGASFANPKAYWKLGKVDYFFGAWALLGIVLWQLSGEGEIALIFAMIGELLAAIPTMIKGWKAPQSETPITFGLCAVASLITLLTVDDWQFIEYGYPLYLMIHCLVLYGLVVYRKKALKS